MSVRVGKTQDGFLNRSFSSKLRKQTCGVRCASVSSWLRCDTSVFKTIRVLSVPVHLSPRCSMLECIRKPFQLVMASSPSPVSPSFSLLSSLSLHYPECLIMAPAFWERVNMAAAPLARKVVFHHRDWLTGEEHGWRGRRRWWLP